MPPRNPEMLTYLFVAILLTTLGGILVIIGLWVLFNNPGLEFQGYAAYAIGGPILLCLGIPLLLSGISRKSDENRRESRDEVSERRKSKHKVKR